MKRRIAPIDELANIVARGFDEIEKKVERGLNELAGTITKMTRIMDDNFQHVNARLDRIRDDVSDLPHMRSELRDLRTRVTRIERKVAMK